MIRRRRRDRAVCYRHGVWVRRAAIRPVPLFAQLPARALADVEDQLGDDDDDDARSRLDEAFARFEATQPALAERVSEALGRPLDETALALGYFLTLAIWLAFDAVFGADLAVVSDTAWVRRTVNALRWVIACEIRAFSKDEAEEGLAWIAAPRKAA